MRIRFSSTLAAAAVLAFINAPAAKSQTDTSLKLTTTVPQALAEFRAGLTDWENFSPEASPAHFAAAIKADPNFGLARVLYGFTGVASGEHNRERAIPEINRGVADAVARCNV